MPAGLLSRLGGFLRASSHEIGGIAFVGALVVAASTFIFVKTSDRTDPPIKTTRAPAASPSPSKMLVVHVSGLVASPGVYELTEGSRVRDAVAAAGGPAAGADLEALNLAALIADGQKIVVGRPGEVPVDPGGEAGGPPAKVNLNTATQQQLEELPSVGPVLAQRIIEHRLRKRFTSARQLMEVDGFGPKKYEALKNLITV